MTTKKTKLIGLGRPTAATPLILLVSLLAILAFSASASAETTGPVWKIMSVPAPTNFKPGDQSGGDSIVVTAVNVGGSSTDGSLVTVGDVLPKGLAVGEVRGLNSYHDPTTGLGELERALGGMTCTSSPAPSCKTSEPVAPGDALIVTIRVDVETALPPPTCEVPAGAAGCLTSEASVSGGGATSVSVSEPVTISSARPEYGVAKGGLLAASSTYQAGGHPNVTGAFFLNTINTTGRFQNVEPVEGPKDVRFDLPPGLVGTAVGVARCTMAAVVAESDCPRNTMVGTATFIVEADGMHFTFTVPVFNIAPAPGEPVAFGVNALLFPLRLDTSVLSDGEYNVRLTAPDITGGGSMYMSSVTIWGDPAEHNGPGPDSAARVLGFAVPWFSFGGLGVETGYQNTETVFEQRVPLLTGASQCSTPLTATLETDSWEAPGAFASKSVPAGTATGCGELSFKPEVSMLPDTLEAGAPAGYSFDLKLPQDTEAEGLATPDVKRTSVTLPVGAVISPSAADGLGVCSNEQFYGPPRPVGEPPEAAKPASCPND